MVHAGHDGAMADRVKSSSIRAVRQSITIPGPLAAEVRRVAKERHLTISRAVVALAERGIRADREAHDNLKATYRRFLKVQDPASKEEAGKDLIRAIFGTEAIAEDQVR